MTKRSPERTEFLGDVLTTAVEGGIGYWSRGWGYTWSDEDPGSNRITIVDHQAAVDLGFDLTYTYAALDKAIDDKDERIAGITYEVTVDTIARGIGRIKSRTAADGTRLALADVYRAQILRASADNDAGDIDSDLADMIVQAGALGQVVYG